MNQYPSYINVNSNQPSSIIKQVLKDVDRRIRRLLSNKKIFHGSCKIYIEALKNSGFREKFTYLELKKIQPNNNNFYKNKETTDNCNIKEKCHKIEKGKLYGLTHPFCKLANINIGKYFFKLIDKHFNQYNMLHKIFNRKTLKISYSCTNNFKEIINPFNMEVIRKYCDQHENNNYINCNSKIDCSMGGICNLKNVYQVTIFPKQKIKKFIFEFRLLDGS